MGSLNRPRLILPGLPDFYDLAQTPRGSAATACVSFLPSAWTLFGSNAAASASQLVDATLCGSAAAQLRQLQSLLLDRGDALQLGCGSFCFISMISYGCVAAWTRQSLFLFYNLGQTRSARMQQFVQFYDFALIRYNSAAGASHYFFDFTRARCGSARLLLFICDFARSPRGARPLLLLSTTSCGRSAAWLR